MSRNGNLKSTEARKEFGLSRDRMTKLLKSGRLPYTADPLDKRIKWVRREDVAQIATASPKRRSVQATVCRVIRKRQVAEEDETPYQLTIGEVMMLLHEFVPYADVARGVMRQFWDVMGVVEAAQTFCEMFEAEYRSGKTMQEIINALHLSPHARNSFARIHALLQEHRTKRQLKAVRT